MNKRHKCNYVIDIHLIVNLYYNLEGFLTFLIPHTNLTRARIFIFNFEIVSTESQKLVLHAF